MGYIMDSEFALHFVSFLFCLSFFPPVSLSLSHVTPLWGGWSHSWLDLPAQYAPPNGDILLGLVYLSGLDHCGDDTVWEEAKSCPSSWVISITLWHLV